jgi:hypothetical protein
MARDRDLVTTHRILGSGRIGTVELRAASPEGSGYRTPYFGRLHRLDDGAAPPTDETSSTNVDERTERWRIPTATFWYILERRVKAGRNVTENGLSEETRRNPNYEFVGRTRMKHLVKWIDDHPEQAERAVASSRQLHDIPPQFRATARGVLIP